MSSDQQNDAPGTLCLSRFLRPTVKIQKKKPRLLNPSVGAGSYFVGRPTNPGDKTEEPHARGDQNPATAQTPGGRFILLPVQLNSFFFSPTALICSLCWIRRPLVAKLKLDPFSSSCIHFSGCIRVLRWASGEPSPEGTGSSTAANH